jgi:hypothetical protein
VLNFSVQTFYPPLFSHSFPFSSFPLATLFPSKSFPHQKAKAKAPNPSKAQSKSQRQKSESPHPPSGPFINSGKQGGAEAGETCLPASLNASIGAAAVLLFLFVARAVPILAYR